MQVLPLCDENITVPLFLISALIRDLTIPDCFISLCNNKSILHPLDYLIFPLQFSEQILHQKCISPQGTVLMAVLTGPNTSISNLNDAFLFIISKTGILSYSDYYP